MRAQMKLEGMHCDSCADDIKEMLETRAGVQSVEVSYHNKLAVVEFDENVIQPQTFVKLIQDGGYQASFGPDEGNNPVQTQQP